jgi:hypothetical protein
MTDTEEDLKNALAGTTKSALGLIPVLSQAIAGYDAYKASIHNRNIKKMLEHLNDKVSDIEKFFNQEWFKTEEGELFARKVIDATIDVQSEEKQELFVNILINGSEENLPIEEKTKFVDMLRQLSLASIQILAEIHTMFEPKTRRPNKDPNQLTAAPQVDAVEIAEQLSDQYDPYLVISAVKELESHGLFSNVHSWHKNGEKYKPGPGFQNAIAYTDFSARFAEFISRYEIKKIT